MASALAGCAISEKAALGTGGRRHAQHEGRAWRTDWRRADQREGKEKEREREREREDGGRTTEDGGQENKDKRNEGSEMREEV